MIKEILNILTSKGRRALVSSIIWFSAYGLSGIGMMLLVLMILRRIASGGESLAVYWWSLAFLLLLRGISSTFGDMEKHFAGFDLNYQLRERIVYRLKRFSLSFYTNERLGEVNTVIHKDVNNMVMVVGHLWPRMMGDFIVSAVIIVSLLLVDIKMGILLISTLPIGLCILIIGLRRGSELERENGNQLADMVSLFVEYVRGIPLLKAFSESKRLDLDMEQRMRDFGESSRRLSGYKAKMLSFYGIFVDLAFGIMAVVGMALVFKGDLDIMTYFLYIMVSKEFYKPFSAMETYWMNYLTVKDSYSRIGRIMNTPVVKEPEQPCRPENWDIEFCNVVGFFYEEDEFQLKDASFHVPEETTLALVGESGSGKTTITNLLLRFWDVKEGSIQIGGVDIRDIGYDDLLSSISIVMQNVQLFFDTIEENIRIGKVNATEEEIIHAAKKARIHNFIMSLPQGYKTLIGENGATLSGGQRQRLSIARAFLKNAPILVLDEFTSSVDPENEALIQEAIWELTRSRTVIVVAHRLSTIRFADQILVFKKGEIAERGRHEELLQKEGYYRRLFNAQAAYL